MPRKEYDWKNGADLKDHTKKKHAVLSQYLREYLITRCQLPQQERFRLAVVDGFAGAGLYNGGGYGSPLIFVDVLAKTTNEINARRQAQGMRSISVECLLILNDDDPNAIELLKKNISPLLERSKSESKHLKVLVKYEAQKFENFYPALKARLKTARCGNVLFNLDQCGYSNITTWMLRDIMKTWRSAEVFLTFAIKSLLAYLSPQKGKSRVPLEVEVQRKIEALLQDGESLLSKNQWLGEAEKIVFASLGDCAPFVSPFSINNRGGWRYYWLMHFANSYRARQVYNQILHEDDAVQAHFGRVGLNMLSYDPQNEGKLYLFEDDSRELARQALLNEIPSFIAESGDAMPVQDFYAQVYNHTPAHADDIHKAIIDNPDIEVITPSGGKRQKANTIQVGDILKLKDQRSLFFMFPSEGN